MGKAERALQDASPLPCGALRPTHPPRRSRSAGGGSDFQIRQKDGVKYIEGVEEPKLIMDAVRAYRAKQTADVLAGPDPREA